MALCLLTSSQTVAQAEGSRTLYPSGATGNRASIEWRTDVYGSLVRRRTLLKVYAKKDEFILLGSSAVGEGQGDIRVFDPGRVTGAIGSESIPSAADFQCTNQAGRGKINSRAEELAGPESIDGASNTAGYTPCFYQAPQDGVYDIVMTGPSGINSGSDASPTGQINLSSNSNFNNDQKTTIAAWDVTIRDSQTSTTDFNGRLFAYYYALFTGGNGRPINFSTYPITSDGFRYELEFRGADPNGFIFYGNQVGFFDSDGVTPLYHSINGDGFEVNNPEGGVSFSAPQYPTFINRVDPDALGSIQTYNPDGTQAGVGIPLIPTTPTVSALGFSGTSSGNTSNQGTGGTFSFSSNVSGNYQIVISRDGTNFDPTNPQNRVLRGTMLTGGAQTVTWNGKDNNGDDFPVGNNYPARVQIHAGEYHFPFIDGENNASGGPTITLLNGSNPLGNNTAFFDDRGYRTLNGTIVGDPALTDAQKLTNALCGANPPSPPFSDPINGFDSTTNARAFGTSSGGNRNNKCQGSFGDTKGLDFWTYFPSTAESTQLNIVAPVSISGTVWNDLDNSANNTFSNIQNGSETGTNADGVNAILVDASNNVIASVAVAANGTYSFPNISPNQTDVTIRLSTTAGTVGQPAPTASLPNDWNNTSPLVTAAFDIVTTDITGRDFGVRPSAPELILVKRITAINGQAIDFYDDDTTSSKEAEDNHANWPTPLNTDSGKGATSISEFLQGRINAGTVKSGDVLQYTIYFLSSGKSAAKNISFCDLVPTSTTFQPQTFSSISGIELAIGNTTTALSNVPDGDRGEYFQPGAIPSTSCASINSNGAVVVNIVRSSDPAPNNELPASTGPGSPNNSFGYVRFEVKVD